MIGGIKIDFVVLNMVKCVNKQCRYVFFIFNQVLNMFLIQKIVQLEFVFFVILVVQNMLVEFIGYCKVGQGFVFIYVNIDRQGWIIG